MCMCAIESLPSLAPIFRGAAQRLTVNRGQFDLLSVYRYLSRSVCRVSHFDKLYGINVDVGLFFFPMWVWFSYTQFENWGYKRPLLRTTHRGFNGARLQIFPTERLKVELWLINGWQTWQVQSASWRRIPASPRAA